MMVNTATAMTRLSFITGCICVCFVGKARDEEARGFHERLVAARAREGGPQGTTSNLATVLLQKWCWGLMSLPMLQLLASAAVQDGLEQPLLRLSICMWLWLGV